MARLRGALRTSFLERSPRIIGAIGLALVLGGSAFALLLTGGVFADTYRVTAYFRDSAGIEPGDEVTVAGLEAGTVKGLRIEDGVVAVDLAVNSDVELTPDTRAEVIVETLLGRKSIDLLVGRGGGRLQDGATIPLDRTSTPIEITELNDISVRLMNASDAEALDSFLAELTAVTEGKATQVRDIITGLNQVTEAIDARRVELSRLLDSLRTLSTALGDKDDTLVSLIDHLDVVLANLARRQQDIELLLTATDSASHETANLVTRNRGVIDATLAALHQDLTVLQRHQLDLAATITYLEQSVQGYSSVGYSQGVPNRWFNIFVQSLGPLGVDAIVGECGAVDQLIDSMLGTDCEEPGDDDGDEPIREEPGAGGGGSGGQGGGSAGDADGDGLTDGIDDLMGSVVAGNGGDETKGVLP